MAHNICFKTIMLGAAIMLLSACDGIFHGLYDEPEMATGDYGFVLADPTTHSGTVYVNASLYTRWLYIDFHSRAIDSVEIADDMQEPASWDIAVHRYDAKTNGGAVLETDFTDMDALRNASSVPQGSYAEDEWSQVTVDMSGMMDGNIVYADSYVNSVLSRWLNVDTSTMPPIYTLSGKIYMVRLADGSMVALRLSNFVNDANVKGYLTIDYIYPFEIQ